MVVDATKERQEERQEKLPRRCAPQPAVAGPAQPVFLVDDQFPCYRNASKRHVHPRLAPPDTRTAKNTTCLHKRAIFASLRLTLETPSPCSSPFLAEGRGVVRDCPRLPGDHHHQTASATRPPYRTCTTTLSASKASIVWLMSLHRRCVSALTARPTPGLLHIRLFVPVRGWGAYSRRALQTVRAAPRHERIDVPCRSNGSVKIE